MKHYLANFDFDWSEFTLTRFIVWLANTLGEQVVLVPCFLPPTICGAYVISPDGHHLILFDRNLSEFLRAHTILHEIAHLLCGHQTARLTHDEMKILIEGSTNSPTVVLPANVVNRSVSCKTNQQEEEAEALALLIQSRVRVAKRQRELMEPVVYTELAILVGI